MGVLVCQCGIECGVVCDFVYCFGEVDCVFCCFCDVCCCVWVYDVGGIVEQYCVFESYLFDCEIEDCLCEWC